MDKICINCSLEKIQEEFQGNRNQCRSCMSIYRKKYYEKNKQKSLKQTKDWVSKNIEKSRAMKRKHYHSNRDEYVLKSKQYRKDFPDRERESRRKWERANSDKVVAKVQRRNATKLKRTPIWSEKFFVDEIYHLAKIRTDITGIKWHVDHVVPLNSELVSGLHCEANLQVIPAIENISKGNRHWPDMW